MKITQKGHSKSCRTWISWLQAQKSVSGKGKTGSQGAVIPGNVSSARVSSSIFRSAQAKSSPVLGNGTITLIDIDTCMPLAPVWS